MTRLTEQAAGRLVDHLRKQLARSEALLTFTTAASGAPQDSLDALRKASATAYYKAPDALWVKVVSTGDAGNGAPGGGTSVQVNR